MITATDQLIERVDALREQNDRVLVGIVGAPGSGKSTVSAAVADRLSGDAVVVPMDGFHLANSELARLGLSDRKGAIDTFDAFGYLHLIKRLREAAEPVVYAPDYVRGVEESIAGSIAVPAAIPVVITEGNYLLDSDAPWRQVRSLLDEIWFVEAPREIRMERLVQRHMSFGMDEAAAHAWTAGPDETNAVRIEALRDQADLIIDVMRFAEALD